MPAASPAPPGARQGETCIKKELCFWDGGPNTWIRDGDTVPFWIDVSKQRTWSDGAVTHTSAEGVRVTFYYGGQSQTTTAGASGYAAVTFRATLNDKRVSVAAADNSYGQYGYAATSYLVDVRGTSSPSGKTAASSTVNPPSASPFTLQRTQNSVGVPGFEAVYATVGLVTVAYIVSRRWK